jgi:hypothetical protein
MLVRRRATLTHESLQCSLITSKREYVHKSEKSLYEIAEGSRREVSLCCLILL